MRYVIALLLAFVTTTAQAQVVISPASGVNGSGGVHPSTCAAPALNEVGAATTGIAFTATPSILNCIAGTAVTTLTGSSYTVTVPVLAPDGSAAAPSMARAADPTTGLYFPGGVGSGVTAWTSAGVLAGYFNGPNLHLLSTGSVAWGTGTAFGNAEDVAIYRHAANVAALATGDSLYLVSGGLGVGVTPPGAGSISVNGHYFLSGVASLRGVATGKVNFLNWAETAGVGLDFSTDALLKLRDSAQTGGAAWNMLEQTAPAAPSANEVTIYAVDNGAGKTRLMVLFSSGAAQQIAIQP